MMVYGAVCGYGSGGACGAYVVMVVAVPVVPYAVMVVVVPAVPYAVTVVAVPAVPYAVMELESFGIGILFI